MDLINPALLDQSPVLFVAQHALLASLKLLPSLLFDHGSVSVQVLSLQADLLELLGESSFLLSLLLLLGLNLSVHLQETFLPSSLCFGSESVGIVLLLKTTSIVLGLPSDSSILNLLRLLHKPLCLLLLACQVSLSFKFSLLLLLSLLELESLTQLGYRHLLHQAVPACFCRVKAFSPLDRDLLKLSDLSDQLHSLRKLSCLFILAFLEAFLEITMHLVSNGLVFSFLGLDLLSCGILIGVNLGNDLFLLLHDLLEADLTLLHPNFHLRSHLSDKPLVLLFIALLGQDCLLSRQLHLNLLFLNVLKALDFVLLAHFCLPAVKFRGVFESHGHLVQAGLRLALLEVDEVLLALQSSDVQLDISRLLVKVWHGPGLVAFKV